MHRVHIHDTVRFHIREFGVPRFPMFFHILNGGSLLSTVGALIPCMTCFATLHAPVMIEASPALT